MFDSDIIASLASLLPGAFFVAAWYLLSNVYQRLKHPSKSRPVHIINRTPVTDEIQRRWNTLTIREIEIAHLVAQGQHNYNIAMELSISIHTVETHLKHIYFKLNVHSRVELVRAILDLGD